jgi:hypothetical protein
VNCDTLQNILQQRLDGALIESPELNAHLRDCPDCRALEAGMRRLQEGLRLLTPPLPPPDLAARITERVFLDRRRARRRARRRWAVTLALAACLPIALLLRLDWHRPAPETEKQGPEVSVVPDGKGTPAPAPTLRESATEAGEAVAALTSQTADEAMGPTRWLVPNVSSPSLPKVDLAAMEPPTQPLREASAGVSAGLEPVTTSARRAFGLFLRELPPMDMGQNGL